jgi:hypothetical protein
MFLQNVTFNRLYGVISQKTVLFITTALWTLNWTKLRGFESASELYRSSNRRQSAKLVPTLVDRGCHVVSATNPSDRNFDFLDLELLLFLPSSSSDCLQNVTFNRLYCVISQKAVLFITTALWTLNWTKLRGFESASELYRSSDRRRSAKLVPTLADRGCHAVSVTNPSDRNFDFLDLEPLLFLPSSYSNCSRGWVDSVADPLLLRKILQRRESNLGPLC